MYEPKGTCKGRSLTIQERFENYDFNQSDLDETMQEIDTGETIGEEKL